MSIKQRSHSEQYHYVSSLAELPEDESIMPSNTTPIEQLGIELLEEVKIPDGEEGDDEPTPGEMKAQFFTLIAELQRKFPGYSATQFKKFLEEDAGMAEQLQILKDNFNESFKDVSKDDPEFINLLIGLSSIGVEIPKEEDEADEGDECDDEGDEGELAKSIIKIDLEEIVTDV
jgi:hypothetical protein